MVCRSAGVFLSLLLLCDFNSYTVAHYPEKLTFLRVGDLHYRIRSIILRNRLQVSPLLSVSETQTHEGGSPGC